MSGISEIQDTLEYLKNEVKKLSAPKQLMTREEAVSRLAALSGMGDARIINALEALGLIKFADTDQDAIWMAKAKKYSDNIKLDEYDYTNPIRTINEMATVISFLYRKITGI